MTVKFKCGGCGQMLSTDSGKAGSVAPCPKCGMTVTVPSPVAQPSVTADDATVEPIDFEGLLREGKRIYRSTGDGMTEENCHAFKLFARAAEAGHAESQYYLGLCYWDGNGVGENNAEAAKWFRKAAEEGHALAQHSLSNCYFKGWGVPQDNVEMAKWTRKSAEQGYGTAQLHLGINYSMGDGVPKDDVEAVKWYRRAAEQGDAEAQSRLSDSCFAGRGISRDRAEGMRWLRKAAEQGHERSNKLLLIRASHTSNPGNAPIRPLTLERARTIVEYAENIFADGRSRSETFKAFAEGGASFRLEAFCALYIVIADYFHYAAIRPGSPKAMTMFNQYAGASQHIALQIMCEHIDDRENLSLAFDAEESVESFVAYLRTLNASSADYWPQVYRRLGLGNPADESDENLLTMRRTKQIAATDTWRRAWKSIVNLFHFKI